MSGDNKRKLLKATCLCLGVGSYPLAFAAWYVSVIAAVLGVAVGLYHVVLYGWDRAIIAGVVLSALLLFTVIFFLIVLYGYVGMARLHR